jgi:hypothetical protein
MRQASALSCGRHLAGVPAFPAMLLYRLIIGLRSCQMGA